MDQSRLDRYMKGIKPTTWVGAIAIREAMNAFEQNLETHEFAAKGQMLKQTRPDPA